MQAGSLFRKTFQALHVRNFRLYFFGQLISNTGNWLTNIAITLLVFKITGSGFAIGLLAACQYGPILLFSAWAGAFADRHDKRRMLLLTQSLEMMESIGLALLAFMPHPPVAGLYAVAIGGGLLLAFDNPLRRSFVSEMVPREDLSNAIVLYSMIVNLSRIFGPALAGLLVVSLGYGWCFVVDAASYLAVIYSLIRMRPAELLRHKPRPRQKGEVRAGLRYVLQTPVLWISFATLAAIGLLAYNFNVTLPIYVIRSLHKTNATYTLLYTVFSVGAVIGTLGVARRSNITIRHVLSGAFALGASILLLAAAPTFIWALPAVLLVGMASIYYMTSVTAIAQLETEASMQGRVLSLQTILLIGSSAVAGPILGEIADVLGGRAPMFLGGITCLLAALFAQTAVRRVRHQSAEVE